MYLAWLPQVHLVSAHAHLEHYESMEDKDFPLQSHLVCQDLNPVRRVCEAGIKSLRVRRPEVVL